MSGWAGGLGKAPSTRVDRACNGQRVVQGGAATLCEEERVIPEARQTLRAFIETYVASPAEWEEWQKVKQAKEPVSRTLPAPLSSGLMFLSETDAPSAEFLKREELFTELVDRLRITLGDGRWLVSGRLGPPETRQDLEPVDWTAATIDFEANMIGRFRHVEVRQARRQTSRQILQQFIERICDAAESPGKPLTKEVIERLAGRLFPEDFSFSDFEVAWKEAPIDDSWRKRGPKRKSESN